MSTSERLVSQRVKGHYNQVQPFPSQSNVTVRVGAPAHLSYLIGRVGVYLGSCGDYSSVQFDLNGTQTCISVHMQYLKEVK